MRQYSLPIIAGLAALAACSESDQRQATRAIAGTAAERCLAAAHWVKARRTGAFVEEPDLGSYFIALDEPVSVHPRQGDFDFAPRLVGRANRVLGRFLVDFADDYKRAGSPSGPTSDTIRSLGFAGRLLDIKTNAPGGWIRGEAKGWLSQERNLSCGSDQRNGRFFIINEFKPAFPISGR